MSVLGERLKALRKSKKLNQTELAEALNQKYNLNIERAMISKWETGYQTPLLSTVNYLADFFNVSIDYLTNGTSNGHGMIFAVDKRKFNEAIEKVVDDVILKEKYNFTAEPEPIESKIKKMRISPKSKNKDKSSADIIRKYKQEQITREFIRVLSKLSEEQLLKLEKAFTFFDENPEKWEKFGEKLKQIEKE